MRGLHSTFRPLTVAIMVVAGTALGLSAADPPDFQPDATFKGSSLTGWQVVGQADWKAENGELVGRAKGDTGGWLMMTKPLQDLQFFANLRCQGPCKTGVLLRAQKTADGGLRGVYVSFTDSDFVSYRVTLNAQGQETGRTRIGAAPAPGSPAATAAAAAAMTPGDWNPVKINLWNETVRTWR